MECHNAMTRATMGVIELGRGLSSVASAMELPQKTTLLPRSRKGRCQSASRRTMSTTASTTRWRDD